MKAFVVWSRDLVMREAARGQTGFPLRRERLTTVPTMRKRESRVLIMTLVTLSAHANAYAQM